MLLTTEAIDFCSSGEKQGRQQFQIKQDLIVMEKGKTE